MVFFENIPLPSLPTYIVATLILSYILWSKFFNKGKLKIKTVDEILDIYIIFLATLSILYISVYIFLLLPSLFSLNFISSEGIRDIIIILVFYFLVVLALTTKKTVTKKDLRIFSNYLLLFFSIMMVLSLSMSYVLRGDPMGHIFTLRFLLLSILFSIPIITIYSFEKRFFKSPQIKFDKNLLYRAILPISLFLIVFFGFPMLFPIFDVTTQPISYSLIDTPEMAFETIDVNFEIVRTGAFGLFSLEFGEYFEPQRFISMSFQYPLNSKSNTSKTFYKNTENDLSIGIKDWKIDEKNKAVFVEVDQDIFKEKGIFRITLRGEREKNISELFIFTKGEAPDCAKRNCTVNLTFINKLNLGIIGEKVGFFEEPIFYGGNCTLHGVNIQEKIFIESINEIQTRNKSFTCAKELCVISGDGFFGRLKVKNIRNYFIPVLFQSHNNLRTVDLSMKISCQI